VYVIYKYVKTYYLYLMTVLSNDCVLTERGGGGVTLGYSAIIECRKAERMVLF